MLQTGRIVYCSECSSPLGVLWDGRNIVSEDEGRICCYLCSKSEAAVRILCGFEKPWIVSQILDQAFSSDIVWQKYCRAQRDHSTVMQHLYPLALFPETFSTLARIYADVVKKKLDKLMNSDTLTKSAENTDDR